jgi:hypothetical protein
MEDRMKRSTRRGIAAGTIAASVELGLASAGPLSWGLGCLLAMGLVVYGMSLWTKPEPARVYDHATDGA